MKKLFSLIGLIGSSLWMSACPLCEKNQPKFLRGITHGTGPESNWDFVIIFATAAIVLYCTYFTIRRLIKPGEANKNHIKNSIFNLNDYGR
jgi:hypothetical protein